MRKTLSNELQNEMADNLYQATAEYADNILDILVETTGKMFNITNPESLAELKKAMKENDLEVIDNIYEKVVGDFDTSLLEFEPKDIFIKILKNDEKVSELKA